MWRSVFILGGLFVLAPEAHAIDVCSTCPFTSIDAALNSVGNDGVEIINVTDSRVYGAKIEPDDDRVTVTINNIGGASIAGPVHDLIKANRDSDLTFDGFDLTTTGDNRCAQVDGGSTLTFRNMTVHDCDLDNDGAGLRVNASDAVLFVYDSYFVDNDMNVSNRDGGHIYTIGDIYVENTVFSGGLSGRHGAGIYVEGPRTITLVDVTFTDNDAAGSGGAYYAPNSPTSDFTNVIFDRSAAVGALAVDGGAIYQIGGSLTIDGGSFTDMDSSSDGGSMYLNGVDADLDDITITDSQTTTLGGGIYATGTDLTITGVGAPSLFTGVGLAGVDQAVEGAGIWCDDGGLTVSDTSFEDLRVSDQAAGVFTQGTCTVDMDNVAFIRNDTNRGDGDGSGMIIFSTGLHSVVNSDFVDNIAGDKAALQAENGTSLTLSNNFFDGNSGVLGAHMYLEIDTTDTGSVYQDGLVGGAVRTETAIDVDFTGCTFDNNEAVALDGGAIWMDDTGTLTLTDTTFTGNSTNIHGGAAFLGASVSGDFTRVTFDSNQADGNGGAVVWDPGSFTPTLSVVDSTFLSNAADANANAAGDGGGIYANNAGSLTLTGSILNFNTAQSGGALRGNTLRDSTLYRNTWCQNDAAADGGAMFFEAGTLDQDLQSNAFIDNSSVARGAAVFALGANVDAVNNTAAGNDSTGAQGAWHFDGGTTIFVNNATTHSSDVGLYATGATFTIRNYNNWFTNTGGHLGGDLADVSDLGQTGSLDDIDPLYVNYVDDALCDDQLWLRTNPPFGADSPLIDAGDPAIFDGGNVLNRSDIGAFGGAQMDVALFGDVDGDGVSVAAGDCDDDNILIFPGAVETPGDGVDQDCDLLEECYDDDDGDGFGDEVTPTTTLTAVLDCSEANLSTTADDCDDSDPTVSPDGVELPGDVTDQDCDGFEDCYEDLDGDFSGSAVIVPSAQLNCIGPGIWFLTGDCDDDDDAIHPGAVELTADGVDQNCDTDENCFLDGDGDHFGLPAIFPSDDLDCDDVLEAPNSEDCDDFDIDINPDAIEIPADLTDQNCDSNEECFYDGDGDGHGTAAIILSVGNVSCADEVNEADVDDDCDDLDPAVNPDAVELVANLTDDDCDGIELCYVDSDGDDFGDISGATTPSPNVSCTDLGESENDEDCNDSDGGINPDENELTGDREDSDCDGFESCFDDVDDDGFGTNTVHLSTSVDCDLANESRVNTDCDDADPLTNPDAVEVVADGKDQTCDGFEECYADDDGDGFAGDIATALSVSLTCTGPGISATIDDCDDVDPTINPGALETVADGVDQDCDGVEDCYEDLDSDGFGSAVIATSVLLDCSDPNRSGITGDCDDNAFAVNPDAIEGVADGLDQDCDGTEECWQDLDLDGYAGDISTGFTAAIDCDAPGFGAIIEDCNDTNPSINPAAGEITADLVDQDCDGREQCFVDADQDGFGFAGTQLSPDMLCLQVRGHSLNNTDCNDADANTYPGAVEIVADATDQDCDGREMCHLDGDDDGFGIAVDSLSAPGDIACVGSNVSPTDDDCDDLDPDVFPGAVEIPANLVDDNCDTTELCFEDVDQDDYGSTLTILSPDLICTDVGESDLDTDCDDSDADIFPGAPEVVEDGVDQDCDGFDLQGCFQDLDGDGFGSNLVIGSNDPTCSGVGESLLQSDCNDGDAAINPNALDDCNGVDDDCDGNGGPTSDEDSDGLDWTTEIGLGLDGCLFDSDGDTLGDGDELNTLGTDPGDVDSDADGVDDGVEVGGNPLNPTDTDGDGIINALDTDDDGDGVPTTTEDRNGGGDPTDDDTDGDGVPDYLDDDDDGDGLLTLDDEDTNGNGDPTDDDFDQDGVPNYLDIDDDDDGIPTVDEVPVGGDPFSEDGDGDGIPDASEWVNGDSDGDGIFDLGDADDDDDGIPTILEGNGDVDGDGVPNYLDDDSDGDGKLDLIEGTGDDDGDFIPNFLDPDDNDGGAADNDGDGIVTADEIDPAVSTNPIDPDSDGDGVDDGTEIDDPANPLQTDGDADIDAWDTDDDGDGIPTINELGPECSDGSNVDVDVRFVPLPEMFFVCADGTELATRNYQDTDSDNIPDYLDADDDGDGIPTLAEDVDGDGDWTNDNVDGDEYPDYLDLSDHDGPLGDLDGDGLTNGDEDADGLDPTSPDTDGDGVLDGEEFANGDSDGDGIIDPLDTDDDDDGIDTVDEGQSDTDRDGIPNYLDLDSDEDGKSDLEEGINDDDCDRVQNYVDADDADGSCDSGDGGQGGKVIKNDGGCACDAGGSGAGWLVLCLALLATRRRNDD